MTKEAEEIARLRQSHDLWALRAKSLESARVVTERVYDDIEEHCDIEHDAVSFPCCEKCSSMACKPVAWPCPALRVLHVIVNRTSAIAS